MSTRQALVFKFAAEDWEFEQIHRLNHRTFVEEIPHTANGKILKTALRSKFRDYVLPSAAAPAKKGQPAP